MSRRISQALGEMHLESGAVGADPACAVFDADEDADLDLSDVASAMNAFTGDCALGITTPPHGSGPCIGDVVTLSVDVRGEVASRQWRKEDADIPGATEVTHTIGPITSASRGTSGTVWSDRVWLTGCFPWPGPGRDQPFSTPWRPM